MDRRIGRVEAGALALVVGQLITVPVGAAVCGVGIAALVVAALAGDRGRPVGRVGSSIAVVLLCLGAGNVLGAWGHAAPFDETHVRRLALPWRGEVEAEIVDGPWRAGRRHRLLVDVLAIRRARDWTRARGRVDLRTYGDVAGLEPGTRFRARLTMRAPRSFRTPGSFDWVGYLARRGVHATGSIGVGHPAHVLAPGRGRWRGTIARWRRDVARRMDRLPSDDARAVLQAIVVGSRTDVSRGLRDRFARAGVAHVLAISGLHVGVVAWLTARLLGGLLLRWPWLALRTNARAVGEMAACVPVALYCVLGGLGPSVVRAAAALGVVVLVRALDRRPEPLRVVAIVAIALAVLDPGLPRDVGFQLSLAAVVGLAIAARRRHGRLGRALAASWGATVATAPLLAHHFQQVPLAAPLAGPALMPFFGTIPVGLGVAGALVLPLSHGAADACFAAAHVLLRPGLWLVDAFAAVPGVLRAVARPSAGEVAAIYAAMAARILWPGRRAVVAIVLVGALLDVGWWTWVRGGRARLTVAFLDVGQGDAAVLELPSGGVVVVDGGGFPGSDFDVGYAVVAPYLRSRKIGRVDLVVATHTHPDHYGGLTSVILAFRPSEVWWPGGGERTPGWRRLEDATAAVGARLRTVAAGEHLSVDGVVIRVLHPSPGRRWSVNDASVVLAIEWAGRRVLLTGDVEEPGERALLASGAVERVDVVKVPHHGSRTSSTARFVRATAPALAVVSAGADNRYGHPAVEVEARWRETGARVLRTDVCGTIVATIPADGTLRAETLDPACRPAARQSDGAMPFFNAYITSPTRSRTPSL